MAKSPSSSNFPSALKALPVFLLRPGAVFAQMAAQGRPSWLMPMLVLSLMLLVRVMVSGYLRLRAASMGEMPLPPGWEWWTPEMQNNYMQAMQATQGPVFVYVIPSISALAGLWLGWIVLSGLLHLASTLLGGRGTMPSALRLLAWASLPLALREGLRVLYMLLAGHAIASPGLSGFVSGTSGGMLFLSHLLQHTDLFFAWRLILLVLGLRRLDGLSTGKAVVAVLVVLLLALVVQAGVGAFFSSLSGIVVNRPF